MRLSGELSFLACEGKPYQKDLSPAPAGKTPIIISLAHADTVTVWIEPDQRHANHIKVSSEDTATAPVGGLSDAQLTLDQGGFAPDKGMKQKGRGTPSAPIDDRQITAFTRFLGEADCLSGVHFFWHRRIKSNAAGTWELRQPG